MTKFSKFDKSNLNALRAEMQAVLEKYGVDANVNFEVGNMRFSEAEVEIKVKATVKGAQTMSDSILLSRVQALGLKIRNGFGDTLVEYNTRSWKMPFVYVDGRDGKRYKCDERTAKIRFAA